MELRGKVAIVTGGAVRIGRALSFALADAGASVLIHYSNSDTNAESAVSEITSRGGQAAAVAANFTEAVPAARTVLQAAVDRFGGADILINSAAIFGEGTLAAISEEEWDKYFAINLKAPCFLCREFAARLRKGQPANIVNIADWRALRPAPGHLTYTLTKSALIALTQILAQELAPEIRVNAVCPGAVLPPAGAGQDYLKRLAQHIPLRRAGTVDDVTSAVLFLLKSDFITGELLCVTGGEHLGAVS